EERRKAAADAVLFRAERYRLFPGAQAQEQALELNEGLAEYTGVRVGNPTPEEQIKTALNDLSYYRNNSTFVRSFAYATGCHRTSYDFFRTLTFPCVCAPARGAHGHAGVLPSAVELSATVGSV